jgi:threonine aldolase
MRKYCEANHSGAKMIDLRSDTVTQPTQAMRQAMLEAPVGDDVYGEDPTVNLLEATAADRLGKPAGLFVSSGTQSNLLALLTHCGRGDEYIVGQNAHTYRFEAGGAAALGGIQPQPLNLSTDGRFDLNEVESAIKPDDFHFAITRLLALENTYSGHVLPPEYVDSVRALCDRHELQLHLDGARLFNAAVALGVDPAVIAAPFDTVSICLSKGLGAPVGSVLLGPEGFIAAARRWRKMLGGGMRQAGVIAAGGLHALNHHIDRLAEDHQHARVIADALNAHFGKPTAVSATNMVHLNLPLGTFTAFRTHLADHGVRATRPRWVMHLDISEDDVEGIKKAITSFRIDAR